MEAAGLVIGVVTLASVFESVISGLDRLQTGRDVDNSLERYLLQLEVLKLRLHRWHDAVGRLKERGDQGSASVKEADGQLAETHLKVIDQLLQKESKLSMKYGKQELPGQEEEEEISPGEEQVSPRKSWMIKSLRRVSQRHTRTINTPPPSSLRRQISWAFRGEQNFKDLVTNISTHIDNLEHIIPTDDMRKELTQMRLEDVNELATQPEANHQDADRLTEVVLVLDPPFAELMNARPVNEWVGNVAEDNARVVQGDLVASGYKGEEVATACSWRGNVARGNSRVIMGSVYGFNPFSD